MSRQGRAIAAAAALHLGVPFRLHGRNPSSGLDCVGLVDAAFRAANVSIETPRLYGLRNADISAALALVLASGLKEATGPVLAGDILLVRPGPAQFHLLVAEHEASFIHAHAGLRRIVRTPGPLAWPVERHWRISEE